jgi:hypothetical protein
MLSFRYKLSLILFVVLNAWGCYVVKSQGINREGETESLLYLLDKGCDLYSAMSVNGLDTFNYTRVLEARGFNFNCFTKFDKQKGETTWFKLYYDGKSLNRITSYALIDQGLKLDYIFNDIDAYVIYIAFIDQVDNNLKPIKVRGIFVYDKARKKNLFFGFYRKDIDICSLENVSKIFILDENLMPTNRLTWHKKELIYSSEIKYKDLEVVEEIELFARKDCKVKDIQSLSLSDLYGIASGGERYFNCEPVSLLYCKPDLLHYTAKVQLWCIPGSFYTR